MRKRSFALLVVLVLATSAFGADQFRDRREERGPFDRIVRIVKFMFGVSSNSDGLLPPRP